MAQYKKIDGGSSETEAAAKNYYYKEEHLEVDLFQRDADLLHRYIICTKNAGHEKFIDAKEITLDDLPEALRQQEMLDYITAVCKLVVRVQVKQTSLSRSKDDPFVSMVGRPVFRGATGCVVKVSDPSDIQELPCNNKTCIQACSHNVYGYLDIRTNKYVVCDAVEAKETEVEFFFDSQDRMSVVTMQGHDFKRDPLDDQCGWVRCVTHDVDFLSKVKRLMDDAMAYASNIPREIRESALLDYAIIISHPHGQSKVVSIGGLNEFKKVPDKAGTMKRLLRQLRGKQELSLRVTTYTAPTCPGCTGAPVLSGFDNGWRWWVLAHSTTDFNLAINMAFTS